jgi:hypothetical protein
MKKALLLFVLLCTFAGVKAQGNLQFNQVINQVLVGNTPVNFTVPAGKVWKIESVGVDYVNTPTTHIRNASNQVLVTFYTSSSYQNPLPYWLSSGFTGNFILSNSATYRGCISIIEFNVVP